MALDQHDSGGGRRLESARPDIIYAAFFSGEQLSRNIWQPIALGALLILALLIALEWRVRKRLRARRAA